MPLSSLGLVLEPTPTAACLDAMLLQRKSTQVSYPASQPAGFQGLGPLSIHSPQKTKNAARTNQPTPRVCCRHLSLYAGFTSEMVYSLDRSYIREDMIELLAYAYLMSATVKIRDEFLTRTKRGVKTEVLPLDECWGEEQRRTGGSRACN